MILFFYQNFNNRTHFIVDETFGGIYARVRVLRTDRCLIFRLAFIKKEEAVDYYGRR